MNRCMLNTPLKKLIGRSIRHGKTACNSAAAPFFRDYVEQHDRLDEVRERTTRFVGLPEMPHSRDRFGRARVERVGLDGRHRLPFFQKQTWYVVMPFVVIEC